MDTVPKPTDTQQQQTGTATYTGQHRAGPGRPSVGEVNAHQRGFGWPHLPQHAAPEPTGGTR